ncbi:dTDP-4-dehydrorhamnose reductase [Dyella sp.]|uniref:dTDP-4-dehydrorhamnose reductase n=1 Tax=Dyella sp. TaxID=1869338 RepID=UPI002D773FFC|nr:dTDP-4-dehydrorhamnose reductase [Dyella sp.]HET6430829.1 dTDP-4-dehydrorhamnose reductase [Dyella sp.]
MKTLLLGANGLLGRDLHEALARHPALELTPATRDGRHGSGALAESVELTSEAALSALLDRVAPQLIVNAAAYTAVDQAELDEPLATRVNGDVPRQLGRWAAAHGALVVHYSTDYVFDGSQNAAYTPASPTAPLGVYGRSKLAGERALQASGAAHMIFRTAWLYGRHGPNFLFTMLRRAAERAPLRVVDDQHGTPTGTPRVAAGTCAALARWLAAEAGERQSMQGIHHLVASGATTWHGFATEIMAQASAAGLLDATPAIEAVDSAMFSARARRPRHAVLENRGFTETFGAVLPPWQEDLRDFVQGLESLTPDWP